MNIAYSAEPTAGDTLLTESDLAARLQLPTKTVSHLRVAEGWEHTRIGRAVRYTAEQADRIIAAHTVAARDRLPGQTVASMNRKRRRAS